MNACTIDLTKIHIYISWYRTPVWRNLPKLIHTCTCDTCMTSLIYVPVTSVLRHLPKLWYMHVPVTPVRRHLPGLGAVDVALGLLTIQTHVVPDTQVLPHPWVFTTAMKLWKEHTYLLRGKTPHPSMRRKKVWRTSFMLFSFHGERYPGLFDFWDFFDA